jgi:predicted nucleic acid-binding protein
MSKAVKTLYWDTSVFLCFLDKKEEGRRKICEDILHHAKDGNVIIATSTFTIVETIRPKWIKPPMVLTAEQIRIIEGMFRWGWVKKYQVDERLALKAVALARDYGLKPGDSIHAATAIASKADVLQMWDRDFQKIAHLMTVAEPAYETKQMPLIEIGPTQQQLEEAAAPISAASASSVSEPPLAQSHVVEKAKEQPSAPALPSGPHAVPAPQPPGSSPTVPQLPPSTK